MRRVSLGSPVCSVRQFVAIKCLSFQNKSHRSHDCTSVNHLEPSFYWLSRNLQIVAARNVNQNRKEVPATICLTILIFKKFHMNNAAMYAVPAGCALVKAVMPWEPSKHILLKTAVKSPLRLFVDCWRSYTKRREEVNRGSYSVKFQDSLTAIADADVKKKKKRTRRKCNCL